MMGDRIVKCISILPNDNKGGIHQMESARNCESNSQGEIANIDECNGIVMNMLKSHVLIVNVMGVCKWSWDCPKRSAFA